MLKQFNLIMILGVSVFLSGCATDSGNTKLAKTSNEQINSAFVKGKTTSTAKGETKAVVLRVCHIVCVSCKRI